MEAPGASRNPWPRDCPSSDINPVVSPSRELPRPPYSGARRKPPPILSSSALMVAKGSLAFSWGASRMACFTRRTFPCWCSVFLKNADKPVNGFDSEVRNPPLFRSVRAGAGRSAEPARKVPLLRLHFALHALALPRWHEISGVQASAAARFVLCDRPVCAAPGWFRCLSLRRRLKSHSCSTGFR